MKGRRLLAVLVLAVLATVLLAVPATAQAFDSSTPVLPTVLHAELTGEQEVPRATPTALGTPPSS